jgi:hypothetical protein
MAAQRSTEMGHQCTAGHLLAQVQKPCPHWDRPTNPAVASAVAIGHGPDSEYLNANADVARSSRGRRHIAFPIEIVAFVSFAFGGAVQ